MEEQQDRIQQLEQQVEQLTRDKQRLEEKLNAALDGTGLCLWEQHVPTGRLRIFNMEWGKMLGFQPNELEANLDTWKSKLHPDDYDLAVGAFEDHLHGRADTYQVVHRMLHKDGSHSWVSDRGRIVEYAADGSPLRIMGTHIDITNEKRYEQELSRLARQVRSPICLTAKRCKVSLTASITPNPIRWRRWCLSMSTTSRRSTIISAIKRAMRCWWWWQNG